MSQLGHSRPGRADCSSGGPVRIGPIATDFCDATAKRNVPQSDLRTTTALSRKLYGAFAAWSERFCFGSNWTRLTPC
jgi:hypothetical protein